MNPHRRRVYSDDDVSRILKRAAALQRTEEATDAYGLSLAELEQIAAEVGIDPRYIIQAAAELERTGPQDRRRYVLGGPSAVELERVVEGTLSGEQWERMVAEISRTFGAVGQTDVRDAAFEWTCSGRWEQAMVTVSRRGGQTRVRIFSQFVRTAILAYLPLMVVGFILAFNVPLALGLSPLIWGSLFISILAAVFLLARFAFTAISRRRWLRAKRLLARLERIVATPEAAAPQAERAAEAASPGQQPRRPEADWEEGAPRAAPGQLPRRTPS